LDEIAFMNTLLDKLEKEDYYFYNFNKINMAFSFIYHFYRTHLFLNIGKIFETNIDVISKKE